MKFPVEDTIRAGIIDGWPEAIQDRLVDRASHRKKVGAEKKHTGKATKQSNRTGAEYSSEQ